MNSANSNLTPDTMQSDLDNAMRIANARVVVDRLYSSAKWQQIMATYKVPTNANIVNDAMTLSPIVKQMLEDPVFRGVFLEKFRECATVRSTRKIVVKAVRK